MPVERNLPNNLEDCRAEEEEEKKEGKESICVGSDPLEFIHTWPERIWILKLYEVGEEKTHKMPEL